MDALKFVGDEGHLLQVTIRQLVKNLLRQLQSMRHRLVEACIERPNRHPTGVEQRSGNSGSSESRIEVMPSNLAMAWALARRRQGTLHCEEID